MLSYVWYTKFKLEALGHSRHVHLLVLSLPSWSQVDQTVAGDGESACRGAMVGKRSFWHQVDELIGGKVLFKHYNFAQVSSNTVGKYLCSLARNVSRTWSSGGAQVEFAWYAHGTRVVRTWNSRDAHGPAHCYSSCRPSWPAHPFRLAHRSAR